MSAANYHLYTHFRRSLQYKYGKLMRPERRLPYLRCTHRSNLFITTDFYGYIRYKCPLDTKLGETLRTRVARTNVSC